VLICSYMWCLGLIFFSNSGSDIIHAELFGMLFGMHLVLLNSEKAAADLDKVRLHIWQSQPRRLWVHNSPRLRHLYIHLQDHPRLINQYLRLPIHPG